MKKFSKMLSLVLVLACMLTLVACGGGNDTAAAGTYKLETIEMQGMTMNLEELAAAAQVDADSFKVELVLNSDGSFKLDMDAIDPTTSMEGTWKSKGNNVVMTVDGETVEAPLKDGVITMAEDGMSMTFKKQ